MLNSGFSQSNADPCLYVRSSKISKLIVVVYVDDGLIAGTDQRDMNEFVQQLREKFEVIVDSLECFLGLQISRSCDGALFVHQEAYAKRILEKFNMSDAKHVSTPLEKDYAETVSTNASVQLRGQVPYREAIGSLMFLATGTRPDLSHAVRAVASKMSSPCYEIAV
jgi:hypothetical protein